MTKIPPLSVLLLNETILVLNTSSVLETVSVLGSYRGGIRAAFSEAGKDCVEKGLICVCLYYNRLRSTNYYLRFS